MKKLLFALSITVLAVACTPKISNQQRQLLKTLYSERNYFKLDQQMAKIKDIGNDAELLLYKATLDNVFNHPEASNQLIEKLLSQKTSLLNDTLKKDLYYMLWANHFRLQQYREAYFADSILINQFGQVCDSSELDIRKDDLTIFRSLADAPRMEISVPADSRVPFKRDLADLQNLTVSIQNDSIDFVFDTGAAFSCIMESLAKKYGARYLPGKIITGTSTNLKVEGHMGLLDIRLGNMEIKNTAFIILPDSLLTFANGAYMIKGIIGFPVMLAFKEMIIEDEKYLTMPKTPSTGIHQNMALDGQYLILAVENHNDTLPFLFDSGNSETHMSARYFNRFKNEIEGKYPLRKVSTGGAGGMVETSAYVIDSIPVKVGDSQAVLKSADVYPTDLSGYDMKYVYGNFGQNYVNQFHTMQINFEAGEVSFLNPKNQ